MRFIVTCGEEIVGVRGGAGGAIWFEPFKKLEVSPFLTRLA